MVGAYCIQDCYLLVLLTIKLQIFAASVEMSRQAFTPWTSRDARPADRAVNQLVRYAHRMSATSSHTMAGTY